MPHAAQGFGRVGPKHLACRHQLATGTLKLKTPRETAQGLEAPGAPASPP